MRDCPLLISQDELGNDYSPYSFDLMRHAQVTVLLWKWRITEQTAHLQNPCPLLWLAWAIRVEMSCSLINPFGVEHLAAIIQKMLPFWAFSPATCCQHEMHLQASLQVNHQLSLQLSSLGEHWLASICLQKIWKIFSKNILIDCPQRVHFFQNLSWTL